MLRYVRWPIHGTDPIHMASRVSEATVRLTVLCYCSMMRSPSLDIPTGLASQLSNQGRRIIVISNSCDNALQHLAPVNFMSQAAQRQTSVHMCVVIGYAQVRSRANSARVPVQFPVTASVVVAVSGYVYTYPFCCLIVCLSVWLAVCSSLLPVRITQQLG